MPEEKIDTEAVLAYIAEELQEEGKHEVLGLLRQCKADLEWNNDDYGTSYWDLMLTFPRAAFKAIRPRMEAVEALLLAKAQEASRCYRKNEITSVKIFSQLPDAANWRSGTEHRVVVIEAEANKIWQRGLLRLFLSHRSDEKVRLAEVKAELLNYGIDCFLAHEEIRATKKWRDTIQQGLQSCDALLAVSTPGFKASDWCMQEVGWGLARGIVVMPLLAGEVPGGFHSEYQGPTANLDDPRAVAEHIAKGLCEDPRTQQLVFKGIAERFRTATSGQETASVWHRLEKLNDCSPEQVGEIEKAIQENPEARKSTVATPRLASWAASHRKGEAAPQLVVAGRPNAPSADEYDPFADE